MTNYTSVSVNEQNWIRREELQRAVLLHLKERGSAKWGALYSHFDEDGTGEIGEALQLLAEWRYITLEGDGTAKITVSGAQERKSGNSSIPRTTGRFEYLRSRDEENSNGFHQAAGP